jgi:murein DD-endopeptidase MepM/ murein hydrolase activator NlpD
MFLIGIVPATQIAKAVSPAKPACPGATYSVVSGDSWYRIALSSKVSMTALMTANGATTATVIHPGQTLCLPAGSSPVSVTTPTTPTTPTSVTPPATAAVVTTAGSIDVFPAQGPCTFGDTYGAPRSGGRVHQGVDIIAKAGQWIYAVKDGTLTKRYIDAPGSLSGNGWRLTTADGTYFFYAHLSAFAPGLAVGSAVKAGQILGQIGKTGDALTPHLHFEVHPLGGASVNPTPVVKAVDGCKVTAVPPQPNGIPVGVPTTTTPSTVPATTIPTGAATTTTTPQPVYVPIDHRRDISDMTDLVPRDRRDVPVS